MPEPTFDIAPLQLAVSLLIAIVGGGAGAGVVWYALVERLRTRFATREDLSGASQKIREDLDGMGQKVEGVKTLAVKALELADESRDATRLLDERMRAQDQRMTEVVVQPMNKLTEKMDAVMTAIAEFGRDLRSLGRGLDDVRSRLDGKDGGR